MLIYLLLSEVDTPSTLTLPPLSADVIIIFKQSCNINISPDFLLYGFRLSFFPHFEQANYPAGPSQLHSICSGVFNNTLSVSLSLCVSHPKGFQKVWAVIANHWSA